METVVLGGVAEADSADFSIQVSFGQRAALLSTDALLDEFGIVCANFKARELPEPPKLRERHIGKFLYLPLTEATDLEPRLELAGMMARRGWQCMIGGMAAMSRQRFGHLPPGVVLMPGRAASDAKLAFQAQQVGGHYIAALAGGAVNRWAEQLTDLVIDALPIPEIERRPLRRVICTNAALVNHKNGVRAGYAAVLHASGHAVSSKRIAELRAQIGHEREMFDVLMACIHKHGDASIWVHPDESRTQYLAAGNIDSSASLWQALSYATVAVVDPGSEADRIAAALGVPRETYEGTPLPQTLTSAENIGNVVCAALESLHSRHAYPMPFDIVTAWGTRTPGPDEMHMPMAGGGYERIAGWPIRALGPSAWAVMPSAKAAAA